MQMGSGWPFKHNMALVARSQLTLSSGPNSSESVQTDNFLGIQYDEVLTITTNPPADPLAAKSGLLLVDASVHFQGSTYLDSAIRCALTMNHQYVITPPASPSVSLDLWQGIFEEKQSMSS